MKSSRRPNSVSMAFLALAPALAAAAVLFDGDPAAAGTCPSGDPPCITRLEAKPSSSGKFMLVVHFSASCHYDVFHLQLNRSEWSPTEWKRSRSELCNNQTQTFLITGNTQGLSVTARIQGCVKYVWPLKDRCTAFSPPETIVLDTPPPAVDKRKEAACQNYARIAATEAKFVRDNHCDPKVYSGPRWSLDFNEHLRWCMQAAPATANFENRLRMKMSEQCRKGPSTAPKGGTPQITVTSRAGDTFIINGSGFPPSAPVIIRVTGPGAAIPAGLQALSITVDPKTKSRIVANGQGSFSTTLFGAQLCKRGGGRVTFTAGDQDRPQEATATSTCAP